MTENTSSLRTSFTAESLLLVLTALLTFAQSANATQQQDQEPFPPSRYGPPRFKQNARTHQFAYLGDTIRFKCNAIGRPQPRVHWYRDSRYLNYSFMLGHPRLKERGMSLEVKRIEVGDRGNWTCRVWNNEGSTTRNFTLHIVDFCDYFLNVHIHPRRVPEECLCQWAMQQRESQAAPDLFHLRALPQLRADLDLSEYASDASGRCARYTKVEEIARLRNQPREETARERERPVEESPTTATATAPPPPTNPTQSAVRVASTAMPIWTLKNLSAKIQLAKELVRVLKQKGATGDWEEGDPEEETGGQDANGVVDVVESRPPSATTAETTATTTTTRPPWTTRATRPPSWLTTKRWSLPQRVPPYFRHLDEQTPTHIVIPAGRTLKLSCKAGGQPEPQVVWRKGNDEILRDTESKTGSLFQLKKWTLELEDATENDSGEYTCEVFNSAGLIVRRFRVEVQDRIRSRPILVPNVLLNRTVDVNGTVDFSCQVISDLVPHIVWIKLIKKDGSFIRWDAKRRQYTFNFLDMSTHKRARIFHDRRTNRYTLEVHNVTMADQGIYSCVAGNTLGMSMANATLVVNEFRPLTLPTEIPHSWHLSYTVLLILSFLLLCAFVALGMLYIFFSKKFSAKSRVQTLDSMSVRKKVVITKKPHREGDFWSDLASSYSITVEPVQVRVGRGDQRRGSRALGAGGTGDTAPLMGEGGVHPPGTEMSLLSDYEVPTDMAWEIERERLQLVDILGEGAFGEVWRGVLRPKPEELGLKEPMSVAVKRLKAAAQERELIILVSEMQILKSIGQHPNILSLTGCCTGLGPLLVVLELCVYGNLKDFLRKHRPGERREDKGEGEESSAEGRVRSELTGEEEAESSSDRKMYQNVESTSASPPTMAESPLNRQLTLRDLVRFAAEIAKGMDFLASKKIIHRDLAARNVLVAENLTMKISDFGLSRNVFYHDYYRKRGAGRLPIKWMAPEALEANVYTVHSDVWSYGILLWEIMTLGGTPYPSIAMPQLYNLLKEGYRMEAPHNCPEEIYGVMVACWQDRPETRPAFRSIAEYFDWMLQEAESGASRSEDGETTDEGPYAVITEGQNGQQGGDAGTASRGTSRAGAETGQQRKSPQRPQSAPGMMSFEVFLRDKEAEESPFTPPPQQFAAMLPPKPRNGNSGHHHRQMDAPPPLPQRRSLIEQLQQRVVGRVGGEEGSEEGQQRTEHQMSEERAEGQANGHESGTYDAVVYKNLRQSPPPSANLYANTGAVPAIHHCSPSSSSAEAITPPSAGPSSHHPPHTRPKKSVVSEHGLRVQNIMFTGIGQQNAKLGGRPCAGGAVGSKGTGTGSSASFGQLPPGSGTLLLADWRSRSVDSSASSGHGGSSAMSSAEGIGGIGAEMVIQEESADQQRDDEQEEGGGVSYVSIGQLGMFPLGN